MCGCTNLNRIDFRNNSLNYFPKFTSNRELPTYIHLTDINLLDAAIMHVNTSTSLTVKRATLIRFKTKILSRNPVGGAQTIRLHHFKIITHTTKQFPGRCKTGTRFKCIHGGTTTTAATKSE